MKYSLIFLVIVFFFSLEWLEPVTKSVFLLTIRSQNCLKERVFAWTAVSQSTWIFMSGWARNLQNCQCKMRNWWRRCNREWDLHNKLFRLWSCTVNIHFILGLMTTEPGHLGYFWYIWHFVFYFPFYFLLLFDREHFQYSLHLLFFFFFLKNSKSYIFRKHRHGTIERSADSV